MSSLSRSVWCLPFVAVAALVTTADTSTPATAAPSASCQSPRAVGLVVDEGSLGDEVAERCVPGGAGRTAAEVTREAGVRLTWVQRYRGSFVCRLDGRPADLPCADTPPADRYWGLFWAGPGDEEWTFAAEGAGSLTVPAGGAVGWRFQDSTDQEAPAVAVDALVHDAAGGSRGENDPARGSSSDGTGAGGATAASLVVIVVLAAGVLLLRRRRT